MTDTVTVDTLTSEVIRGALGLLEGAEQRAGGVPQGRAAAARALRETLSSGAIVRTLLDVAPAGAREAFLRIAQAGPAPVEELLGRGWWGRGTLPPPLDWLQRRALVAVTDDGRVAAIEETRAAFTALQALPRPEPLASLATVLQLPLREPVAAPVEVLSAASVVVAVSAAALEAALAVGAAALRGVAPTVAVSARPPQAVTAALRAAGLELGGDLVVPADASAPALPGSAEDATGPRAVRAVLERAVGEARQVRLQYFASSRGGVATERVVDPWTFRDGLLRGWCHLRRGERTFALDRIGRARLLPSPVAHPPQEP